MAAETVSIPSKRFDELAQRLVASGRYNSPSEVLEAAIDALEREECDEEAKELYLEQALEAGFSSGVAEGDVIGRIRARHGLSAKEIRVKWGSQHSANLTEHQTCLGC